MNKLTLKIVVLSLFLAIFPSCRDSQFKWPKITLNEASPIPRIYPLKFVWFKDDGKVVLEVEGARKEFSVGDVISTKQGNLKVVKTNPATRTAILKKQSN